MENRINIAELLKDCPKGMELDCALFEGVYLEEIIDDDDLDCPVLIKTKEGETWNLTSTGCWDDSPSAKCVIFPKGKTTWEGFQRPFKDGDILVSKAKQPFIFQSFNSNNGCCSYCGIDADLQFRLHSDDWAYVNFLRFATEEEKTRLFQVIKDNGYKWNAETKTLDKLIKPSFKVGDKVRHKNNHGVVFTITSIEEDSYVCGAKAAFWFDDQDDYELVLNKFDINTLKPFESRVLVRHNKDNKWTGSFFSFIDRDLHSHCYKFVTTADKSYPMMIPFKGNEYLLGKTDDCQDFYKTWES